MKKIYRWLFFILVCLAQSALCAWLGFVVFKGEELLSAELGIINALLIVGVYPYLILDL